MIRTHILKRTYGDGPCMANVVSYILGVPREGVPNFTLHEDFWGAVDSYLYAWGLHIQPYNAERHYGTVEYVLYTGINEADNSHIIVCDINEKLLYDSFSIGGSLTKDINKWVIVPYTVGEINE